MVTTSGPLILDTTDCAYAANSMYFFYALMGQETFVIRAWCAADFPSLRWKSLETGTCCQDFTWKWGRILIISPNKSPLNWDLMLCKKDLVQHFIYSSNALGCFTRSVIASHTWYLCAAGNTSRACDYNGVSEDVSMFDLVYKRDQIILFIHFVSLDSFSHQIILTAEQKKRSYSGIITCVRDLIESVLSGLF